MKTGTLICFLIKGVPRYPHSAQLTLPLSPTHLAPQKPHKKLMVGLLKKGVGVRPAKK